MNSKKPYLSFSNELAPLRQFINGAISLDEFMRWLNMPSKEIPIKTVDYSLLISREEQDLRREAVRQANASTMLEGFVIAPEIGWLNECYIRGEISIDEKGLILRKMFGVE